jgi:hypothetical protein
MTIAFMIEEQGFVTPNGLIRDFFPKSTDFSIISSAEMAKVEHQLNSRPRKSLRFRYLRRSSTLSLSNNFMHCEVEPAILLSIVC